MLFELFLGKLGGLLLSKVGESFWLKVVDKTTDKALDDLNNFNEFDLTLRTLQKNLKSLSAKASDLEEEIKNAELSGRKKRKREVEEWLGEVKLFEKEVDELGGSQAEPEGFIKRLTEGGKAAQLDKQAEKLVERSRNFGELVLDICGTTGDTFLTKGLVGRAFNKNLETILRLLESREVASIGVYGMGGVGKTTLVQHINNRLKQHPGRRVYWVTVSQEFTVTGLQDKIARLLGLYFWGENEVSQRAKMLQTALSQKRSSVLILDGVWDNIDLLEVGCLSSSDGCKLIITTRYVGVCCQIRCQKEILVEKLDEGEAWKLFHERLGNEIELDPEVEGIAKSMVQLCGGVPLAIITVARSMKGMRDGHRWRNDFLELQERVKGHDGMGEDVVFKVLKFSFDWLKEKNDKSNEFNRFQLCFLYCSLYPEDNQINREELVEKFMSGGLLDESRSRRARVDQGNSILDELVDVCLLESCVDSWNLECVKMHDLVRSMALEICKGKYMVRSGERSLMELSNEEEWTKDLEKVSFMECGDLVCTREGLSPNCPKLSTLLLLKNRAFKVIPNSFFSKMKGLCTLDLTWNDKITMLPNSISDMTSLKSLVLQYCFGLREVPYLGKMKALRELNLSYTRITESPQGLDELFNLRFLSMNAHGLELLPKGLLPKLGHLQHLSLPFQIQVEIEEIKNLKQLEEFSGGFENVSDFNRFITTHGVHDPAYAIHVCSPSIRGFGFGRDAREVNKELLLSRKNVKDEKVLAKGIADLTISECEGLSKWFVDDLSERFDHPTSLKRLKIRCCQGMEWIFRSDGQGSEISTLEEIKLEGLDDLKGVVMVMERERGGIGPSASAVAQPPVFPFLKILNFFSCKKLRKVGLPVSALPNLEEIDISWCEEVEYLFEEEDEGRAADSVLTLSRLKRLELSHLPRVRKVGLPVSALPNLEELRITGCEEVEYLFEEDEGRAADSVLTLSRLKRLELSHLPRVRKVGLAVSGVPSLEAITIGWCGGIEEIFEEEYEGIAAATSTLTLTRTLPNLTHLNLNDLPRLKSVSKATIISNSVERISLSKCPRLMHKLPLDFEDPTPPPCLRDIRVEREWWESLEWDTHINPNLPQLLQPFLRFEHHYMFMSIV